MFPIQTIMAPLADRGLCLHAYPHSERTDGTWVLRGSTLQGDKSAHLEVDGTLLSQAFPADGGKFLVERHTRGDDQVWVLTLMHDDEVALTREFPPDTSVFVALKDFFTPALLKALAPHLLNLTQTLGRM